MFLTRDKVSISFTIVRVLDPKNRIQGSTDINQSEAWMKRLTYRSQALTAVSGLARGIDDKIDSSRAHLRPSTNQNCAPSWGLVPFFFLLRFRSSSWLSSSLPSLVLSSSPSSPLSPHLISLPSPTSWPVDPLTIMLGNSRAANPPRPASLLVLACIRPSTLRGSSLELDISFQGPN